MHWSQTQHKQPNTQGIRDIYILSQAIQGFVELSCKVQVVQHLLILFHSRLKWKSKDQITSAGSRDRAHLRNHNSLDSPFDLCLEPHPVSVSSCSRAVSAAGTIRVTNSSRPLLQHSVRNLPSFSLGCEFCV